ncbi:MAG: hypothetical protein FJ278_18855, partial [Planctomycetes bacterium]|nr:hypothetical protein [Planctomycetota bacterium]
MSLEHAVRAVHDLDSLLALLRDELRWPLDKSAALADSTFDWTPGELRVLPDHAARLKDGLVRQLRPLTPSQPWGVFFVEFSDGRVYRTALRQVLRGLVPSRRKDPDLQSWQRDNLLFICTTKECDRFTFAHFRGEKAPKAKLCTFGWERDDPYVRTLCEYNLPALGFPDDGGEDAPAWLAKWAKAF